MKIQSTRVMTSDSVRSMCIYNSYCTRCDNEQYSELLERCHYAIADDEFVAEIAEIILSYSNKAALMYKCGCSEEELFRSVCFDLIQDCCFANIDIVDDEEEKK